MPDDHEHARRDWRMPDELWERIVPLLRVCPTFYTSGNSASCGPFSRKSATSKERDFIAW